MSDLVDAAASGDRLATLRALRDVLALAVNDPETAARDLAALTGRLQAVLAEIDELAPPAEVKGNPLDEIGKRRAARGSSAPRVADTKVGR